MGGWVGGWPGGWFCKEIYPLRGPTCNRLARLKQSLVPSWARVWQLCVRHHERRMKYRNCEAGDVVLVLDKEGPKGKFTLGVIDSVKVDPDDIIRKVTVKYKLSQGGEDTNLVTMQYK